MQVETAAGGVVFRRNQDHFEVVMIKDRYGKWALPKGKTEPGETPVTTALREIKEEIGVKGEVVAELSRLNYVYQHPQRGSVDKVVVYFLVRALNDRLIPQAEEVEAAAWMSLTEAEACCDYANNLPVIRQALLLMESSG